MPSTPTDEPHIKALCHTLRDNLSIAGSDSGVFVHLAIAGERLRRAVGASAQRDPDALRLLDEYDQALTGWSGPVPEDHTAAAASVLDDLAAFARRPIDSRDPEEAADLTGELDEVMCVAVAASRAGGVLEERLDALFENVAERVAGMAGGLQEVWTLVETRSLVLAPDPEYPGATAWWEYLARLAPERALMAEALKLRSPPEREALIDAAVAAFEERNRGIGGG